MDLHDAVLWFRYGLQKRDKNFYGPCVGWVALDAAVIVGAVIYSWCQGPGRIAAGGGGLEEIGGLGPPFSLMLAVELAGPGASRDKGLISATSGHRRILPKADIDPPFVGYPLHRKVARMPENLVKASK